MKYQVPLYKLNKNNVKQIGKIIVEKTSLGVYEITSGKKIRATSGVIEISDLILKNEPFIKISDLNGSHLVFSKETAKDINKKKLYNYDRYMKQRKKIKKLLK